VDLAEFRGNGGKVWGAATIIEAIANGATPIAFA